MQDDPWVGKIPWKRKWQTSTLAWEIPWAEETAGINYIMSQRVGHNLASKQQQLSIISSLN